MHHVDNVKAGSRETSVPSITSGYALPVQSLPGKLPVCFLCQLLDCHYLKYIQIAF